MFIVSEVNGNTCTIADFSDCSEEVMDIDYAKDIVAKGLVQIDGVSGNEVRVSSKLPEFKKLLSDYVVHPIILVAAEKAEAERIIQNPAIVNNVIGKKDWTLKYIEVQCDKDITYKISIQNKAGYAKPKVVATCNGKLCFDASFKNDSLVGEYRAVIKGKLHVLTVGFDTATYTCRRCADDVSYLIQKVSRFDGVLPYKLTMLCRSNLKSALAVGLLR